MDEYKRILEVPFSSSRKMMLTVTHMPGQQTLCPGGAPLPSGSEFLVVCKGAPNYIVDLCSSCLAEDGTSTAMTDAKKEQILRQVDEYSGRALRVLAIATRPLGSLPFDPEDEDLTTDSKFNMLRQELQLVGLVASIDPARDGVMESVASARGARIRVVMITGDYLKT